ncbi:helix-turn-helix domain-containing protein [Streptomyces sp. NBC_00190]|uniref:helix-turn-helix domain-containing protein n=1 Tax=unclassified Streptomyces TaxID=2593676 RepID=UPI002E2A09A5|nr:helix-turn-helix domain-containing protein [Streptomyces sp. NBC_00190]WSZ40087.1 helix-turn-helix domain-containing protein [Streptomyces sp. NBC_00868]
MHEKDSQAERYVKIDNNLAQHGELSLTAIGLSTHIQSLPTGADVSIKALAQRFTEGEARIASALRELEAHGYLSRTRERLPSGQIFTRTVSYNIPLSKRLKAAEPVGRAPAPAPAPRQVQAPDPDPDPEPAPAPAPIPRAKATPPLPAPAVPGAHREAAELLARLRLRDPRLLLSERDVARLAPGVTTWLERGLSPAAVSGTLAGCLPAEPIRSPAALLAHRLREYRPPLLPDRPSFALPAERQIQPFQTCDGCDRAFRSATPGQCGTCAAAEAA